MLERVVRLEERIKTHAQMNQQILERLDSLDERVRKLERYIWIAFGALGVLQFAIPLIFGYVK